MSETGEHPLLGGSRQVLMLSTVVMAVVAVAVLALGIQDPRLLRLGLVAALWAALLGAFATARVRRETSSWAEHADQLRTLYQRELECEATARQEHALTVERELREQAQRSQRREIVELRTELTALRASLEQLLGSKPQVGAESAHLLPQFRFGAQGRHGAPGREWSGSNQAPSTAQAQLTVSDLLAAHGVVSTPVVSTPVVSTPVASTPVASTPVTSTPVASTPRRSHDYGSATRGAGVFRHSVGGVAR